MAYCYADYLDEPVGDVPYGRLDLIQKPVEKFYDIDNLPYLQRQTVMFYYYDEMTVEQISALMDCPAGTVKSRLNYARQQIKLGVEEQEKKGVKLYGVPVLPVLSILLKEQAAALTIPQSLSGGLSTILSRAGNAALNTAGSASQGAVASQGAAPAAGGVNTANTAGKAATLAAKLKSLPIWAKIVSIIVAVAVVIGVPAAVILANRDKPVNADPPDVTDDVTDTSGELKWEIKQTYYKEYKASDGTLVGVVEYNRPVFSGKDIVAAKFNSIYELMEKDFLSQNKGFESNYFEEDVVAQYEQESPAMKESIKDTPYQAKVSCEVTGERAGAVSFETTSMRHSAYSGANAWWSINMYTFDLSGEKQLYLPDILLVDETNCADIVFKEFQLANKDEELEQKSLVSEYEKEFLAQAGMDATFCLREDGVHIYFDGWNHYSTGHNSKEIDFVIPYTRTDLVRPPFAQESQTATTTTTAPVQAKNLIDTMSDAEIQKLNKFFDPFCTITPISKIKTEKDVVAFGVLQNDPGNMKFSIPKGTVDSTVKQYFNVEKINHENVGDNGWDIPSYRGGFYNSGGGYGWVTLDWSNVSELTDNKDGTYTAKVSLYKWTGGPTDLPEPENIYDKQSKWVLKNGGKIVNGYEDYSETDIDIHRISTDTVVLKPYTHNGESTWQITEVNGWVIPKTLY